MLLDDDKGRLLGTAVGDGILTWEMSTSISRGLESLDGAICDEPAVKRPVIWALEIAEI